MLYPGVDMERDYVTVAVCTAGVMRRLHGPVVAAIDD